MYHKRQLFLSQWSDLACFEVVRKYGREAETEPEAGQENENKSDKSSATEESCDFFCFVCTVQAVGFFSLLIKLHFCL